MGGAEDAPGRMVHRQCDVQPVRVPDPERLADGGAHQEVARVFDDGRLWDAGGAAGVNVAEDA